MWCKWHCHYYHCIHHIKMTETMCNIAFLVMWCHWYWCQYHIMSTVSSMGLLHLLHQDDQNETWLLWSCDAISTSISIMSYQWHHQYHSCICLVRIIETRCYITVSVMWHHWQWHHHQLMMTVSSMESLHFLGKHDQIWGAKLLFCYVIPLVPQLASYDANRIIRGTTAILRSRWVKWSMNFW